MEGVDFWEDSQFDSYGAFDDSMNMVIEDSIADGDSLGQFNTKAMYLVVEDTQKDEKALPTTRPCFGRRKTAAMNMVVEDSSTDGDSLGQFNTKAMHLVVEDTQEDEKALPTTRPCFGRRKTAAMTNDSTLNQPCGEDKSKTVATKGDKDFYLNKLPIRGMFKLHDPEREEDFIEMLRLLLPDFY